MLIKLRTNQDIQQVLKVADAGMYYKRLLESKIASSSNDLSHIADAILSHHEHWDGNGYPRKLKGREIPYLARIISVIDSYDVMTHARVYKQPISRSAALVELRRCSGTQFDPEITLAFCHLLDVTPLADIGHHKVLSINPSVSVTPN